MTTPSPLPLDTTVNPGDVGHLQSHDDTAYYINLLMTTKPIVLGPTDPVPPGTPAGTLIVRTVT